MLVLPNLEAWQFTVHPGEAYVEDSAFLAASTACGAPSRSCSPCGRARRPPCAGASAPRPHLQPAAASNGADPGLL